MCAQQISQQMFSTNVFNKVFQQMFSQQISPQMFSQKISRSEGAVVIEDQRAERSAAEWGTARWFPRITTRRGFHQALS